jgi:hypothetical protein
MFSDYKNSEKYERQIYNFYCQVMQKWSEMEELSIQEVEYAMLEVVAKTLSMEIAKAGPDCASAFYEAIVSQLNSQKEIQKDLFI